MKTYKLKLLPEQIQYLHSTLSAMIVSEFTLNNIDHTTYYNIKSFIRRVNTKLYNLSNTTIDIKYHYQLSIDLNETDALKIVYAFNREGVERNDYLNALYLELFRQIQKQEIDLMERHKYMPPTSLMLHKMKMDNFKKLE